MKFTLISTWALALVFACQPAMAKSSRRHHARAAAAVAAAAKYNKADSGTPAAQFSAKASFPVAKIAAAALKAKKIGKSYAISEGSKTKSNIYTDWSTFKNGSAYVFTADMDVDCDGLDSSCKGNPDGQKQTDYGALAAYEVPWIVIPETFVNAHKADLPGNNVAAIICDGKMYYGIFGDSNGDSPQVIGEASWLLARTCFGSGMNGNEGHGKADVTYIVFTGKDAVLPSSALTKNYITQFKTLKTMGDDFMTSLTGHLGIKGSSTDTSNSTDTGSGDDDGDDDSC